LEFACVARSGLADRDKNKMPAHMKKRQQVHIEINELML
jgi:hypothetical protein